MMPTDLLLKAFMPSRLLLAAGLPLPANDNGY